MDEEDGGVVGGQSPLINLMWRPIQLPPSSYCCGRAVKPIITFANTLPLHSTQVD